MWEMVRKFNKCQTMDVKRSGDWEVAISPRELGGVHNIYNVNMTRGNAKNIRGASTPSICGGGGGGGGPNYGHRGTENR